MGCLRPPFSHRSTRSPLTVQSPHLYTIILFSSFSISCHCRRYQRSVPQIPLRLPLLMVADSHRHRRSTWVPRQHSLSIQAIQQDGALLSKTRPPQLTMRTACATWRPMELSSVTLASPQRRVPICQDRSPVQWMVHRRSTQLNLHSNYQRCPHRYLQDSWYPEVTAPTECVLFF